MFCLTFGCAGRDQTSLNIHPLSHHWGTTRQHSAMRAARQSWTPQLWISPRPCSHVTSQWATAKIFYKSKGQPPQNPCDPKKSFPYQHGVAPVTYRDPSCRNHHKTDLVGRRLRRTSVMSGYPLWSVWSAADLKNWSALDAADFIGLLHQNRFSIATKLLRTKPRCKEFCSEPPDVAICVHGFMQCLPKRSQKIS